MTIQLTEAQKLAIEQSDGHCIRMHDDQSGAIYVLCKQEPMPTLSEANVAEINKGVEEARQQIANGEVVEWDFEQIKSHCEQQHRQQDASRAP